jgi:hypothetical protein
MRDWRAKLFRTGGWALVSLLYIYISAEEGRIHERSTEILSARNGALRQGKRRHHGRCRQAAPWVRELLLRQHFVWLQAKAPLLFLIRAVRLGVLLVCCYLCVSVDSEDYAVLFQPCAGLSLVKRRSRRSPRGRYTRPRGRSLNGIS